MGLGFILMAATAWAVDSDGDGWEDDVVHPTATVPLSVTLGAGTTVQSGAMIGENTTIGDGCIVATRANVGRGVTIGDRAIISRGARIDDFATLGNDVVLQRTSIVGAFAQLADQVGIGFGSSVGAGTRLGELTLLGALVQVGRGSHVYAGSVVARDARLGDGTRLGTDTAGSIIGPGVQIDAYSRVGARARIRKDVRIGVRSSVGDSARVGRDTVVGQSASIGEGSRLGTLTTVGSCATVAEDAITPRDTVIPSTCGPATLVDIGAGRHGWSDGYLPATCAEYRTPVDTDARTYSGYSGSGVYRLMSASGPVDAYCDMLTDGGGWTLLAKFAQPAGGLAALPQPLYDALAADAGWIQGDATAPTSPTSDYLQFDIESHAWADLLGPAGTPVTLRQRVFRNAGSNASDLPIDYKWNTVYNGHVVQDTVPQGLIADLGAWPLTDRIVLQDASSITWDVPSAQTSRFWLPFTNTMPDTSLRYTACGGFALDTDGCTAYLDPGRRRFGSAGIIGDSADNNDPAASWAPLFDALTVGANIAYVHQATPLYGTSSQPTTLQYWVR